MQGRIVHDKMEKYRVFDAEHDFEFENVIIPTWNAWQSSYHSLCFAIPDVQIIPSPWPLPSAFVRGASTFLGLRLWQIPDRGFFGSHGNIVLIVTIPFVQIVLRIPRIYFFLCLFCLRI